MLKGSQGLMLISGIVVGRESHVHTHSAFTAVLKRLSTILNDDTMDGSRGATGSFIKVMLVLFSNLPVLPSQQAYSLARTNNMGDWPQICQQRLHPLLHNYSCNAQMALATSVVACWSIMRDGVTVRRCVLLDQLQPLLHGHCPQRSPWPQSHARNFRGPGSKLSSIASPLATSTSGQVCKDTPRDFPRLVRALRSWQPRWLHQRSELTAAEKWLAAPLP